MFNTTLAVCTAYLDCCQGRPERVPAWLRERDLGYGSFMYHGVGFQDIVTGFSALAEKRYVQLSVYCDAFERDWSSFRSQLGAIHSGIFRAASAAALHGESEGTRVLCGALDIAVRDGVVLPFAECAGEVLPLLSQPLLAERYPADYLEKLTALCRRYLENVSAGGPVQVQLSERESEILRLLSESRSHSEIAAALYISVPTVRYHIKNIYQKLGVNNKVAALTKARDIGLLQ